MAPERAALDVKQLRYFLAITEEGSFSAAATKLGLAQPSLSQHLVKLESDLGVQLLIRTRRGVITTEPGAALAGHARDILRAVDLAVEDVRNYGGEARGEVAIGLPSSLSMVLSVPLAETVRNDHPRIALRILEAMSGHIQSWLGDGVLDLGCLYDVHQIRHLAAQPVFAEDLFLVAAPDNWPAARGDEALEGGPVALADIADLPLVLPSRSHGLREMIERHARAQNLHLNVVLEMDALTQIKALVERASAYTILAHAAVLEEVRRGDLLMIPIARPVLRRTVYLVRKHGRVVTRASLEIERLVFEIVGELIARREWRAELLSGAKP